MGKDKKAKKSLDESQSNGDSKDEISYEDRLKFVSVISKPMASKKLAKKVVFPLDFCWFSLVGSSSTSINSYLYTQFPQEISDMRIARDFYNKSDVINLMNF